MPPADLTTRIPRWSEGKQRVLNAHQVPPRDAQRDLPDIPVRARVKWAADGAEHLETVASTTPEAAADALAEALGHVVRSVDVQVKRQGLGAGVADAPRDGGRDG